MKKQWLWVCCLSVLLLSGCQKQPADAEPPQLPPEDVPLVMDTLTVEISRDGLDTATLANAVRILPGLLEAGFAETEVEVGRVKVTAGASPADTVKALEAGGVDLAFLPAEALAGQESTAPVILVSGPLFWDQGDSPGDWNREPTEAPLVVGHRALICTAPTEYGRNLAQRKTPTWEELSRARWGVLSEDSLIGYRALNLWLADHYEGGTIANLANVTEYADFEALLYAAANGEIDLFPMREDLRSEEWAERWMLPVNETDFRGDMGFGGSAPIWEETPVIGLTEWFYDMAIVAAPGNDTLEDPVFAEALNEVLRELRQKKEFVDIWGYQTYDLAPEDALAPMRRLLTVE